MKLGDSGHEGEQNTHLRVGCRASGEVGSESSQLSSRRVLLQLLGARPARRYPHGGGAFKPGGRAVFLASAAELPLSHDKMIKAPESDGGRRAAPRAPPPAQKKKSDGDT